MAEAGVGGSTRVTIIFPDYSILKQWLQVTVGATPQTGLQSADVFYFGNAVGESNSPAGSTVVDSSDEIAARNNPASFLAPVGLTNAYDFNRDGLVNGIDQILARSNTTSAVLQTNLVTLTNPPGLQQGLTSGNSSANPSATTGSSSSSAVAFGLAQLSSGPPHRWPSSATGPNVGGNCEGVGRRRCIRHIRRDGLGRRGTCRRVVRRPRQFSAR